MAKGGAMSFEAAKAHLEQYELADRVIVFDQSSATVAMAAQAAGTSEAEIAKTLSFFGGRCSGPHRRGGRREGEQLQVQGEVPHQGEDGPDRSRGRVGGSRSRRCVPLCRAHWRDGVFGRVSPSFRIRLPRMRKLQQRRAPYARGTRARIRLCWVARRVQAARNGAVTASMFKKIG